MLFQILLIQIKASKNLHSKQITSKISLINAPEAAIKFLMVPE